MKKKTLTIIIVVAALLILTVKTLFLTGFFSKTEKGLNLAKPDDIANLRIGTLGGSQAVTND